MRVVVLGAGLVGVASAWYLAEAGHEVTVIDRQPAAALETSFANGGQISVSHAEPWANPSAPLKVLKWLARADAPLLFRPRLERMLELKRQEAAARHFTLRTARRNQKNSNRNDTASICGSTISSVTCTGCSGRNPARISAPGGR